MNFYSTFPALDKEICTVYDEHISLNPKLAGINFLLLNLKCVVCLSVG